MIEVVAENGVFEFPLLPQFYWAGLLHYGVLTLQGVLIVAGPFVCGLRRWPFRYCFALSLPVALMSLVGASSQMTSFHSWKLVEEMEWVAAIAWIVFLLGGVSGLSYPLGRWVRKVWLRRQGVPDRIPSQRDSWLAKFAIVSLPPCVWIVLLFVMHGLVDLLDSREDGRHYKAEMAYIAFLEEVLSGPGRELPTAPETLKRMVIEQADLDLRGLIQFLDPKYDVEADGGGYRLEFKESPRRIRGELGRVWIEEK